MSMKLLFGIAIAWMMVTQALCQTIFIDPTLNEPGVMSCSSYCPQQAPCGIPVLVSISTACSIFIGNGNWPAPLVIEATGALNPFIIPWDSAGTGDYVRNLQLNFTGGANTQLFLDSWNATGTTLNVTSNVLAISNSAFNMDGVEPFNIVGIGTHPRLDIRGTSLSKTCCQAYVMTVGPSFVMNIWIADSTITMPYTVILGSSMSVTIQRSYLNVTSLITDIISDLTIADSHLVGFTGSLTSSLPPSFTTSNSTFIGRSETQIFILFGTINTLGSVTLLECNFTWVRFPLNLPEQSVSVSSVVATGNTFHAFRLRFLLISPSGVVPFRLVNNTFLRDPGYPALELITQESPRSVYLSGNQFQTPLTTGRSSPCSVSVGNFIVNSVSNLVTDGLCVANTQFDGSLDASFVEVVPGSVGYINTTGNITVSSFTSGVSIAFSQNRLHYSITNASQGIDAIIDEMPQSIHLAWQDSNQPLVVGDTWPVFTKVNRSAVLPSILSSDGSFTYALNLSCTASSVACVVNFTILSFNCPCNPQHSLPCGNPFVSPCTCIPPWTGPTCDISSSSPTSNQTSNPTDQSCPTPQPGPGFVCQSGTWSSNTSITQDTLNIPSNSGTIVVNGNLTITQTVIFQGLGSLINVTGCIFVDGGVVVELTDHNIEEIRKGSKTSILMSSVDGNDCESSNDLSLIPINVKTPDKCVKVDAVNSGSKHTLAATFTMTESKCSSSHLVAIIVPSVVGGVIILSAVAIIVILKIRHDKMHH